MVSCSLRFPPGLSQVPASGPSPLYSASPSIPCQGLSSLIPRSFTVITLLIPNLEHTPTCLLCSYLKASEMSGENHTTQTSGQLRTKSHRANWILRSGIMFLLCIPAVSSPPLRATGLNPHSSRSLLTHFS